MLLDDKQIADLWSQAAPFTEWKEWLRDYLQSLRSVQALTPDQLRTVAGQDVLWDADGLGSIGPGSAVVIPAEARRDLAITGALADLRARDWSKDARERAQEISQEYQRILELLVEKYTKKRPQARLLRAFAALMPSHVHCGFNAASNRDLAELLLTDWRELSVVEQHVLVRDRLRRVLGPEKTDEDLVHRSVFCWWLHENREAIEKGAAPTPGRPPVPELDRKPIGIYPFHKQFKGNMAIGRMSAAYRDVVQTCLPGIPRDDLIETLGAAAEFAPLSKPSRKQLVSRVIGLGLVTQVGQLLRPTPDGDAFLENDLPDALVERMLERVYPFAAFLRMVGTTPSSAKELKAHLRKLYPNWTEDLAPSFLIAWAKDLGLVEKGPAESLVLTAYGQFWVARLPEKLPTSPPPAVPEPATVEPVAIPENGHPSSAGQSKWPSVEQVVEEFKTNPAFKTFVFPAGLIRSLHYAFHCNERKRFVILSGLSGTGKTAIADHYAKAFCKLMGLDERRQRRLIAVSPDWQDHTGLLGYLNALHEEPTYQLEPALNLVLAAAQDPANPYFLILDEMNLARVERYFAPFLSAMETGDPLRLHGEANPINGVPASIPWPRNLFIAGTVNMDETTHSFSDKVLDRSFVLEFWDVDLPAFFARRAERDPEVEAILLSLNEALLPIRRHFGYRTAGEVLSFVSQAGADKNHRSEVLDQAVYAKVLPRIRGEDGKPLQAALQQLKGICDKSSLQRSGQKLLTMDEMLRQHGVTRFWS